MMILDLPVQTETTNNLTDNIHLVSTNLALVDPAEVKELERTLGIRMPPGYATFLSTLGTGNYCDLINIYSPQEILDKYIYYREKLYRQYTWLDRGSVLPEAEVHRSYFIADTTQGDIIIFHPNRPDHLFVLPQNSRHIYLIPDGFEELLDWRDEQGRPVHQLPEFRYFTPDKNRQTVSYSNPDSAYDLQEMVNWLSNQESFSVSHVLQSYEDYLDLFIPEIGGRIQIQADPEILQATHFHIEYDATSEEIVAAIGEVLNSIGFE